MKNAPCMDCEERHPGCHGECERYKAFSAGRTEARRKRREFLDRFHMTDKQQKSHDENRRRSK